jgi:anti-sigma B factor antagonist
MTFSYSTSQQEGITIFTLEGDIIDKNQATALVEQISNLIAKGKNHIVLELSGVKYMNSSGLNILVNILTKARSAGGDVTVCKLSKKVEELLVVTKLDTIFKILPSVEEAVKKLKAE